MTILLVGNPNCGKTTLFNRLTGAKQRVANRPGVTVDVSRRRAKGRDATLIDLPGLYSLHGTGGRDEGIAAEAIHKLCPDLILNIVDASNLSRNLYLTTQLQELGVPMILALNMADECQKKGVGIDPIALGAALHMPALPISARFGTGIPALTQQIKKGGTLPRPLCPGVSGEERYRRIARLPIPKEGQTRVAKAHAADRFLLRPWLGMALFFLIMGAVFALTFDTLGAWLTGGMETLAERCINLAALACSAAPAWLSGLLVDGVLRGLAGVLAFLPQVALLNGLLTLLEDVGYLSRAAFLMDDLLSKIGLNGKAFVPLLLGFGCTVPAILAARCLDDVRERRRVALLLPCLSCSAKLPVYGLLARCFFPAHRGLIVLSLYALGILVGVGVMLITKRIGAKGKDAPFLMELPPYRRPGLPNAWAQIADRTGHFLYRAGTVILLMSVLVWAALHLTPRLVYTGQIHESLAYTLGAQLAPLFAPLGFGTAAAAVALLTGLVAKEAVVATLMLFYGTEAALMGAFTPGAAYCFLVFVLLYPPCFATLATLQREFRDLRFTLGVVLLQILIAYGAANLILLFR